MKSCGKDYWQLLQIGHMSAKIQELVEDERNRLLVRVAKEVSLSPGRNMCRDEITRFSSPRNNNIWHGWLTCCVTLGTVQLLRAISKKHLINQWSVSGLKILENSRCPQQWQNSYNTVRLQQGCALISCDFFRAAPYVAQVAGSEASHHLKACHISNILPPLPSLQFCSLHEENVSYFLTRQLQSPLCWSAGSRRTERGQQSRTGSSCSSGLGKGNSRRAS